MIDEIFNPNDYDLLVNLVKQRNEQLIQMIEQDRQQLLNNLDDSIKITQEAVDIGREDWQLFEERKVQLKNDSQRLNRIYQT